MTEDIDSPFSEESQILAQLSAEIVARYHHDIITREHILLAFFETSAPTISKLFEYLKVDVKKARKQLEHLVSNRLPTVSVQPGNIHLDMSARQFIENSQIETARLGEKLISSETLLLALVQSYFSSLQPDITMQKFLKDFGLNPDIIRKALLTKSFWENV